MKIMTITGTRPQFVKAAAISNEIRGRKNVTEILVHTGQHYDANMSDTFFDELNMARPTHMLEVGSGQHGAQTGRMLEKLESVMLEEKPDWVLVYGDTNSTLAGALAATKQHIPVAHVESGLRSFNRTMPEEINRVVTDHISDLLFVPTESARTQLHKEGIDDKKIIYTGDVMYDISLQFQTRAEKNTQLLEKLKLIPQHYYLATIHRAENTDHENRLRHIFEGFFSLSEDMPVVLPLHPRTKKYLSTYGMLDDAMNKLTLLDPIGFLDMMTLTKGARAVLTDSGGVQKEAFFCETPCITLRDETEWVELVDLGWNTVISPAEGDLAGRVCTALGEQNSQTGNPYGEGNAAKVIIDTLLTRSPD